MGTDNKSKIIVTLIPTPVKLFQEFLTCDNPSCDRPLPVMDFHLYREMFHHSIERVTQVMGVKRRKKEIGAIYLPFEEIESDHEKHWIDYCAPEIRKNLQKLLSTLNQSILDVVFGLFWMVSLK